MLYGETLNKNVFYLVVTIKIESKKKEIKKLYSKSFLIDTVFDV